MTGWVKISIGGGSQFTITAMNPGDSTAVTSGIKPASGIVQGSLAAGTAVSPAGTGVVGLMVTTPVGVSDPTPSAIRASRH